MCGSVPCNLTNRKNNSPSCCRTVVGDFGFTEELLARPAHAPALLFATTIDSEDTVRSKYPSFEARRTRLRATTNLILEYCVDATTLHKEPVLFSLLQRGQIDVIGFNFPFKCVAYNSAILSSTILMLDSTRFVKQSNKDLVCMHPNSGFLDAVDKMTTRKGTSSS